MDRGYEPERCLALRLEHEADQPAQAVRAHLRPGEKRRAAAHVGRSRQQLRGRTERCEEQRRRLRRRQRFVHGGSASTHPGEGGTYAHVVFTAPSHGQYNVAATFYAQQYAINADVEVLVNGKLKFSDTLTTMGESHSYAQSFLLKAGDTVDFVVGPNGQPELHAASEHRPRSHHQQQQRMTEPGTTHHHATSSEGRPAPSGPPYIPPPNSRSAHSGQNTPTSG